MRLFQGQFYRLRVFLTKYPYLHTVIKSASLSFPGRIQIPLFPIKCYAESHSNKKEETVYRLFPVTL